MFDARMKKILEHLEYEELVALKEDIAKIESRFRTMLDEEIRQRSADHATYCATCGETIDAYGKQNYTILFGPEGLRKKASFCGIDCMGYFLSKMKAMRGTGKTAHKTEPAP